VLSSQTWKLNTEEKLEELAQCQHKWSKIRSSCNLPQNITGEKQFVHAIKKQINETKKTSK
jgi:hypothetical protein